MAHKCNPSEQAKAPRARIWRKANEGLKRGCTAKASKTGTGARVVKVMVAISYHKGVIICEDYEKMCGNYFSDFISRNFEFMFKKTDEKSRMWLQDGDPSQNSAKSRRAMKVAKSELLLIPPRSPDLNPIENIFHKVRAKLDEEALNNNITKENFDQFKTRLFRTINSVPIEYIDKIIESMNKRIDMIIENKGDRLKY